MLELRQISFRHNPYQAWLFKNVSMVIESGQVVGLGGPSGSGKTTLGRIAAGFLPVEKGRILTNGKQNPAKGAHPVQMIFQHPELAVNPRWKAKKILKEGYCPSIDQLEKFEISQEWLSRYPCELSGGQLARICLVRALCPGTRFLIMDEATAMLDPLTQARIWKVLLPYCRQKNIGILAISHDEKLLKKICTQNIFQCSDLRHR